MTPRTMKSTAITAASPCFMALAESPAPNEAPPSARSAGAVLVNAAMIPEASMASRVTLRPARRRVAAAAQR